MQVHLGNVVFIFPVSTVHERKIQIEAESQSVYCVLHFILNFCILFSCFVFVPMFSFCPAFFLAVTLFSVHRLFAHKMCGEKQGV